MVIATTERGNTEIRSRAALAPHVEVLVLGTERVQPERLIEALGARGLELVLCEGGPHLMADLFSAHLVDELFLTIAPQVAGRTEQDPRLGLVEGFAFEVGQAPWAQLVDLRASGSHLFARYTLGGREVE